MKYLPIPERITPQQLRIGNRVSLEDDNSTGMQEIVGIERGGVKLDKYDEQPFVPFDRLWPMKLSPEILRAAGFRFSNVKLWYEDSNGFVINNHKDGAFYCPFIDPDTSPVIDSLHELQNLYFALMGKELELTEPE